MYRLRPAVRLFASVALAGLAACGSPPDPVGSVSIDRAAIELPHGGWERLGLSWRMDAPLAELDGELRVLLHLYDGGGELERTFDHPFPGDWVAGEESAYEVPVFQSALAPPLEIGDYELVVGLYDAAGHRWPLETTGRQVEEGVYHAATVAAVPRPAGLPEVSFSADWVPTEPGVDQQILARRWLAGDGAIRIRGISAPGSVWLRVGVPRAGERQELVVAEGAAQPAVILTADCSEFEAEIGGSGSHTLEIPLAPAGDSPAECRLQFSANFQLTSVENREKRTIALENLAWRPE